MRRRLCAALAVAAVLLGAADPAAAAPATLTVTGLHQTNGAVEFYLSTQDLPPGAAFSQATVTVRAAGVALPATVSQVEAGEPHAAAPRTSVLVLDASGSMAGAPLAGAQQAALAYLSALPTDVRVGVVTVSRTASVAVRPTTDRAALTSAIGAITASGDTALYDGIADAARLFGAPASGEQRRILVLSDGADTSSHTTVDQARSAVGASGAVLDGVAFRTTETATAALGRLITATGGRRYTATDSAALATAFRTAAGSFAGELAVRATVPAALAGRATQLEITAAVAGTTVSASVPVTFDIDPNAVTIRDAATARGISSVWYLVIGAVVFLALLTFGLVLFAPLIDVNRHRRRVAQMEQFRVRTPVTAGVPERSPAQAAAAVLGRVQSPQTQARSVERLDLAGLRGWADSWPLLRVVAVALPAVLLGFLLGPVLGVLIGAVLGWLAPSVFVRRRIAHRRRQFAAQLPDALQLVIGSLRSGFSLNQALDAMAREAPEPAASEFARALAETRLGADLENTLARVAARMDSKDLSWAVVAIRVQREVGGNLAEVLTTTVTTMREREALRRHVRALAAEGRLSAYILVALPIVVALLMLLIRPAYLAPLVGTLLGWLMIAVGLGLLALGGFWMSRVIRVEV